MLADWLKMREQVAAFDKAVRNRSEGEHRVCRLLMSVPDIGSATVLADQRPMPPDEPQLTSSAY
jgi:hypothetical protein